MFGTDSKLDSKDLDVFIDFHYTLYQLPDNEVICARNLQPLLLTASRERGLAYICDLKAEIHSEPIENSQETQIPRGYDAWKEPTSLPPKTRQTYGGRRKRNRQQTWNGYEAEIEDNTLDVATAAAIDASVSASASLPLSGDDTSVSTINVRETHESVDHSASVSCQNVAHTLNAPPDGAAYAETAGARPDTPTGESTSISASAIVSGPVRNVMPPSPCFAPDIYDLAYDSPLTAQNQGISRPRV